MPEVPPGAPEAGDVAPRTAAPDFNDVIAVLRAAAVARLPETVRGGVLDPRRRGAIALGGLALVAVAVAGVFFWRA
ncbi:MAG: hypothetical protein LC640_05940, partial [Frankia sp.]|nr:hypothetical protein [Frankia sp.]